jgi:hypothetical protein
MSDTCERCGHAFGPHVLAATVYFSDGEREVPAGGHMYCPVAGCECQGTWSVPDAVAGFDVVKRLAELGPLDREAVRRIRGH